LFNVLFIVESYYHNAQPNGICTKKVVDELKNDSDINVTVITSRTVSDQPAHSFIHKSIKSYPSCINGESQI
jgi:hypothetical protein